VRILASIGPQRNLEANNPPENYNSYLVKRRSGGGAVFTRDPLNLLNKQTRKHSGFVNDKAIGIAPGEKGGVTLITKKGGKAHQPSAHHQKSGISGAKGSGSRK
jgi:large subunit ribosomal protein L28e